jgi:tripeptidyl-peptidase I
MKTSLLLAAVALAAGSFGLPSTKYVVHEKRSRPAHGWYKRSSIEEGTMLPMKIGLTQRNLDKAHEFLMDVSDPKSVNFGKHWTPKQVAETFAPR